jgi:hypothetical protein
MGAAPSRNPQLASPAVGTARAYAKALLNSLGAVSTRPLELIDEHPALSWARSGLMALTGPRDGEPQMCPVPLAACADAALAALASLAPTNVFNDLRGSQLLAERAAIAGHMRAGRASPGGSCRLLETADGGIALNLARDDDWALLPAWLECEVAADWESVTRIVQVRSAQELVQRGRLLGLAVAADETPHGVAAPWFSICSSSPRRRGSSETSAFMLDSRFRGNDKKPLVVDLSSLWAGPLCSHLLQRMGADVIKVESTQRPDGARQGPLEFFELLNAGKRNVVLDFSTAQGREQLRALIARADIIIEGSRPRALRQLGIHAEELLVQNPGLSWITISGYGRGEAENWIAYGDDAAVAAGLSSIQYQATGHRMIVGDAIADPLTGLHAALAAWASWLGGGGRLVSLELRDVVNHCIQFDLPGSTEALRRRQQEWIALAQSEVAPPCART